MRTDHRSEDKHSGGPVPRLRRDCKLMAPGIVLAIGRCQPWNTGDHGFSRFEAGRERITQPFESADILSREGVDLRRS